MVEEAGRAQAPGELGRLLRREGMYSSHLTEWRRLRGRKPCRDPLAEECRKLRAQNQRLERKLEQAAAIIDVQKKLSALLGIALPETGPIGDGERAPPWNSPPASDAPRPAAHWTSRATL